MELIGRFPHGTERETLRLEVGVLHGQVEHVAVDLAVLGEVAVEVLERMRLGRIAEVRQARGERRGVERDRARRLLGLTREGDRLLVGVGHDRPVRRVGRLRQLDAQVIREPARLAQLGESRGGSAVATRPGKPEHHGSRERSDGVFSSHTSSRLQAGDQDTPSAGPARAQKAGTLEFLAGDRLDHRNISDRIV